MVLVDKTGMVFGRLTVIARAPNMLHGKLRNIQGVAWYCRCSCGNMAEVSSGGLRVTKSCGCLKKETLSAMARKHGESNKTKEYRTYLSMRQRCYNNNNKGYRIYGARGIKICDKWLNSYEAFLEDMGRAPSARHSIERDDVNGDYTPSNCRWATAKEQANNTRRNVWLEHDGVKRTYSQWAEALGLKTSTFSHKIRCQGLSIAQIINNK